MSLGCGQGGKARKGLCRGVSKRNSVLVTPSEASLLGIDGWGWDGESKA